MFTDAQVEMVATAMILGAIPTIGFFWLMMQALFRMLTRYFNSIIANQVAAELRGKEVQENVRNMANGSSVHHAKEEA